MLRYGWSIETADYNLVVCAQEKRLSGKETMTHLAVKYRDIQAATKEVRGCSEG